MASEPAGQGNSSSKNPFTATIIAILVAFGPPAIATGSLWSAVRAHIPLSCLILVAYWLIVSASRFLLRVARAVSDLWVPRVATAVDLRLRALVNRHRARYVKQLVASVRDIELLGMSTQGEFALPLRDVYVDVSLAPSPLQTTTRTPFVGAETATGERRTLDSFLNSKEPRVFAIIGGPGSGKTTLLRRTALSFGEGPRRGRRLLPVILYLRDHAQEIGRNPNVTIPELLVGVSWLKGLVSADLFERDLEHGRCVVMLDGLDEVASEEQRRLTSKWVQDQVARYPRNHFVLTSRPHGYQANPVSGANVLQVRRFTSEQIFNFVRGWYYAIECRSRGEEGDETRTISDDHADDLLRRMRLQPALYDLAANPMLLTMIANVHKYRGALPGSRAALYSEMCALLLHRRQQAKNLQVGTNLKTEQRAMVVRKLALAMMSLEVRDVTSAKASEILGPTLNRIPRAATPEEFLDELTRSGLLIEREAGTFAFVHQTLQEYLAAVEIRNDPDEVDLPAVVENPWWRETTLLWAADADASAVVAACLESRSVDALALALDCAEEAREVDIVLLERLDQLHDPGVSSSDAQARKIHRRLMAAVRTSRSLRVTVTLSNGAVACAQPIPQTLYQLYVEQFGDPAARRAQYGEADSRDDSTEAVGIPAADAERLVLWVNGLFDGGTTYRLPTRAELADPTTSVVVDLARHTVWYSDAISNEPPGIAAGGPSGNPVEELYAGPKIFVPRGVKHPYVPAEHQVKDAIQRDLAALSSTVPFILALCLERDPGKAYVRDFRASVRRLDRLANSLTPSLERNATQVDRAISRLHGGFMEMQSVRGDVRRLVNLTDELATMSGFSVPSDLAQGLRSLYRRDPQLARALGQALDIILANAIEAEEISALADDRRRPGRSATSEPPATLLLAWPDRPEAANESELPLHVQEFELTILAMSTLLSLWELNRTKGSPRSAWEQFTVFLDGLCSRELDSLPTIPEEVEISLQSVQSLLLRATWGGLDPKLPESAGSDPGRDDESRRLLARRVVDAVAAITKLLLQEPARTTRHSSTVRIGLLAAICVSDRFLEKDIARTLRGVYGSLVCMEARQIDPSLASEVVLLMRA
ncbi:NACHT domain-containing protein [Kribbella sp. NBC_01510]|uniref:NACHT domain-containing protein n=1 Tax=Kribbella sp. NBC_01510 TaxID=2903581 RepID=UPI003863F67F